MDWLGLTSGFGAWKMSYPTSGTEGKKNGPRIWNWTKQDFRDFGWFRILPLIDCEYVSRIVISLQLLFASLLLPAGLYVDRIMDYTCLPNDSILVLPLKSLARCVASTLPDCKLPRKCTSNWQPFRKSSIISIYQPTWTSIFRLFLVHLLVIFGPSFGEFNPQIPRSCWPRSTCARKSRAQAWANTWALLDLSSKASHGMSWLAHGRSNKICCFF